jgi:hypothetical protein
MYQGTDCHLKAQMEEMEVFYQSCMPEKFLQNSFQKGINPFMLRRKIKVSKLSRR